MAWVRGRMSEISLFSSMKTRFFLVNGHLSVWFVCCLFLLSSAIYGGQDTISIQFSFDVRTVITLPRATIRQEASDPPILVYFALPNGNTIEQTMGRIPPSEQEWRYGIQHIDAQTRWLRKFGGMNNLITVYLETKQKSWPAWKKEHFSFYKEYIRQIDSTIKVAAGSKYYRVCLNGHSGGGRFIFSYIDAFDGVPEDVERIAFLDSNYGYEFIYKKPLLKFTQQSGNVLTVFAYNDSVALLNGERIVSDTGGTWHRSNMMLKDLSETYTFSKGGNDDVIRYSNESGSVFFFLKNNPDRRIYHTQQVALNGYIHSMLAGTPLAESGYRYYGEEAYKDLINK